MKQRRHSLLSRHKSRSGLAAQMGSPNIGQPCTLVRVSTACARSHKFKKRCMGNGASAHKVPVQEAGRKALGTEVGSTCLAARTDDELRSLLLQGLDRSVIVNYGSSWCTYCHELFPQFYKLSAQHPEHLFVIAQVDYMRDALQGIRYTPTFAVYRKGRKVDQFFGPSPAQLRDRVWLHSEACAADEG